jgi:hypothetical protein
LNHDGGVVLDQGKKSIEPQRDLLASRPASDVEDSYLMPQPHFTRYQTRELSVEMLTRVDHRRRGFQVRGDRG